MDSKKPFLTFHSDIKTKKLSFSVSSNFNDNHPQSATLPKYQNSNDWRKMSEGGKAKNMKNMRKRTNSVISCLVCFEKSPNGVFMNCGHGGSLTFPNFDFINNMIDYLYL